LTKPRRTRFEPEVRRQQILDATAQLVTAEGLSAVSMERIGREAHVSKALVYNYFTSRNGLLAALLEREVRTYRHAQRTAAEAATDVASMVRVTTRAYLDHVAEKGVLIERLMSDPAVAAGIRYRSAPPDGQVSGVTAECGRCAAGRPGADDGGPDSRPDRGGRRLSGPDRLQHRPAGGHAGHHDPVQHRSCQGEPSAVAASPAVSVIRCSRRARAAAIRP
jgi:AcrR family transcriptional regulator